MADNYAAQRQYIEDALKANPGNKDLLNARDMINYRQTGQYTSSTATEDVAKIHAQADAARAKGPMTPERIAAMNEEYNTRMAASAARQAAGKAAAEEAGRRGIRDVAGKVAQAAGKTIARTVGIEAGMVMDAVPSPFRQKSSDMKSLDAIRQAASQVY